MQFQVLGYDKKIIAPDFNEVSKQGLGQKLKLSMKSSMKSFKKVLFSVINWFKGRTEHPFKKKNKFDINFKWKLAKKN